MVNNAGITKDGLLMRMSEEDFRKVTDINLVGTFNVTRNVTIKLSSVERDVLSLVDSKKGIKRSELAQELDKTYIKVLQDGAKKAQAIASKTLKSVQNAVGLLNIDE